MGHGAFAILGIGMSGYLFLTNFLATKYRVPKYQGHHLIYKCFFVGLIFFCLSAFLFVVTWPITSNWSFVFDFFAVAFPQLDQPQFNFYCIILSAVLMAQICSAGLNRTLRWAYHHTKNREYSRRRAGTALIPISGLHDLPNQTNTLPRGYTDRMLEIEIYQANTDNNYIAHVMSLFTEPTMLLITLSSKKCYVCIPYQFNTPKDNEEEKEISIIPVASGFRHGDDQCLEITTYYKKILRALRISGERYERMSRRKKKYLKHLIASYRITISYDQVVSVASFDISQYRDFKESENSRRKEIESGRNGKILDDEKVINPL